MKVERGPWANTTDKMTFREDKSAKRKEGEKRKIELTNTVIRNRNVRSGKNALGAPIPSEHVQYADEYRAWV